MVPSVLAAALLLAVALPTAAQSEPSQSVLYVCTDSRGRTFSGDRPPPECANGEMRVLNRDGSLRRVIAPPLTAEQRAAKAAEELRKAEEDRRALEQRRRDRALLDTYASESDIEAVRDKTLAGRDAIARRSKERIVRLAEDRKKLDDEAEFYAKRDVPNALKRAYVNNDELVKTEERILADNQIEMDRIRAQFDAELARFRELTGAPRPTKEPRR